MDKLNAAVEAILFANGSSIEPSRIAVALEISESEARDRLERMNALYTRNPEGSPFYGAPVVLVVLVDKNCTTYENDGELVIQNIMLAATDLGIGSCYIWRAKQVFESEEGKQFLADYGIEGDYEGVGNVILGYADCETPKAPPRKENWVYRID